MVRHLPSRTAAVAMDVLALLLFVVVGVIRHEGFLLRGIARTAIPVLLAWAVVALIVGTYRRTTWTRLLITWLVAIPLGLLGRSLVHHGPWGKELLIFGGVAMAFTLLFLLVGRLLLWVPAVVRAERASAPAS